MSKLGSINIKDVIKSFCFSFLSALLMGLYGWLNQGKFPSNFTDLKPMLIAALTAGVGFIIHTYFSNSNGHFMEDEPIEPSKTSQSNRLP